MPDPDHSTTEERFVILGISKKNKFAYCVPLLQRKRRSNKNHKRKKGYNKKRNNM